MKLLGTITLETDRLILRKFTIDDAPKMFKNYGSDSNVNKFFNWKTHKTINDSIETIKLFMKEYENNGFHWAVLIKDTNELIGDIAINHIDKKNNNCEIGYQFGSNYWGKGYATETLKVILDYLLNDCEFNLVEGKCRSSNVSSSRVMEKAGMNRDAILPKRRYNKYTNEYEDLIVYSITKE